jgi:hypothetical protein
MRELLRMNGGAQMKGGRASSNKRGEDNYGTSNLTF